MFKLPPRIVSPTKLTSNESLRESLEPIIRDEPIALIADIAQAFYFERPKLWRLNSEQNFVYLLEFKDGTPNKVIKIARPGQNAGVLIESKLLSELLRMGINVPKVEFTQDDYAKPYVTPFFLMSAVIGTNLLNNTKYRDKATLDLWCEVGRQLGIVSKVKSSDLSIKMSIVPFATSNRLGQIKEMISLYHRNKNDFVILFNFISKSTRMENMTFGQVDAGPQQLIIDGDSKITFTDWTSAGLSFPHGDLASFIRYTKLYCKNSSALVKSLFAGYNEIHQLGHTDRIAIAFTEAYYYLNLALYYSKSGSLEQIKQLIAASLEQMKNA